MKWLFCRFGLLGFQLILIHLRPLDLSIALHKVDIPCMSEGRHVAIGPTIPLADLAGHQEVFRQVQVAITVHGGFLSATSGQAQQAQGDQGSR